jgi:hypothetical protein
MTDHTWLETALVMIMTMREDDAARWQPDDLVEFAKSFSVDALGFSVGGITAFYPTDIPNHPRSPSLGDRDLVGDTVRALHEAGLRAVGRIDASLASKAIFSEHPDWFAFDTDGRPIGVHGAYVACPNGGYYRDFMLRVIREILERYPLDGLWANAAQFSPWHTGMCFCPNCQRKFRAETGEALPRENWGDPVWRSYNECRYRWIADWNARVHKTIADVRPECAWLPLSQVAESWDHARRGGWDVDYTEPHVDGLVLEAQRRYANMWWPGMETRYLRGIQPDKPACITASYFLPWWRFYHVPVAENRLWIAQILAHGAKPWIHVTGFFSEHFDRRGLDAARSMFAGFQANRDAYDGLRSAADVALVYSRHTLDNLDGDDPEGAYLDHFRGAYNAMMAERIPFDILSDKRLSKEILAGYRAVVLPNLACMSDAALAAIHAYVEGGGHVVMSFKTGFHDALGAVREPSPLLEALALEDTGVMRRDMKAAYGRIRDPGHPLFRDIGDTDVLPLEGDLCILRGAGAAGPGPLSFIPPVEGDVGSGFSVPEFNEIDAIGDYPLVIERKIGSGTIVYFPWQPERIAFHYGFRDLFRLIGNAVRQAPGWHDRVTIEAPGLLDIALMTADDRLVLHLLNFSAPGSFNTGQRRIVEDVMPISGARVRLRLPEGRACVSARAIVAGADIAVECDGASVAFTLPELREFETVLLRLSA